MTKTVTVTKPAAKTVGKTKPAAKQSAKPEVKAAKTTAPAATKAEAKTAAPKVETPKIALAVRTVAKDQPVFAIAETARPGAGKALFAHTNAVLTALGLLKPERPAVPKSSVLTLMGQRAVTHHLKSGNFEDAPDTGLRLSSTGLSKFRERQGSLDVAMANGFLGMILDGKTDGTPVSRSNLYSARL